MYPLSQCELNFFPGCELTDQIEIILGVHRRRTTLSTAPKLLVQCTWSVYVAEQALHKVMYSSSPPQPALRYSELTSAKTGKRSPSCVGSQQLTAVSP